MLCRFSIWFDISNVISGKARKKFCKYGKEVSMWANIGFILAVNCIVDVGAYCLAAEWKLSILWQTLIYTIRKLSANLQARMEINCGSWQRQQTASSGVIAHRTNEEHLMTILMCFCWFFWVIKHNNVQKQWKSIILLPSADDFVVSGSLLQLHGTACDGN